MGRPWRWWAAGAILGLTACSSAGSVGRTGEPPTTPSPASPKPSSPATPPAAAADWPTYHGSADRAGFSPAAGPRPPLHVAWRRRLDAAAYAQPIGVGGLVVVATENNSVYALDRATGAPAWHTRLGEPQRGDGLPCGNIDPLGITGTPAYDRRTGSVFVVTETVGGHHTLVALDSRSGRTRWRRDLDIGGHDRVAQQERAALLVTAGRVYAAFGGLYGDCGDYVGYVAAVATDGRGPVLHYAVPTRRAAGIWAPAGPVVGANGSIFVASGNGAATSAPYDGSDSVIRLSPSLRQLAFFAPSTWPEDNAADLDLGSSSPVPVGERIVMGGKRGVVFLLSSALGGVGREIASVGGCAAFGGAARRGSLVVLPCTDGIRALEVGPASLTWRWRVPGVTGSPVITADTVWALDRNAGRLVAVALASGAVRAQLPVGAVTRFVTPAPIGHLLVIGTTNGVVAVSGP